MAALKASWHEACAWLGVWVKREGEKGRARARERETTGYEPSNLTVSGNSDQARAGVGGFGGDTQRAEAADQTVPGRVCPFRSCAQEGYEHERESAPCGLAFLRRSPWHEAGVGGFGSDTQSAEAADQTVLG